MTQNRPHTRLLTILKAKSLMSIWPSGSLPPPLGSHSYIAPPSVSQPAGTVPWAPAGGVRRNQAAASCVELAPGVCTPECARKYNVAVLSGGREYPGGRATPFTEAPRTGTKTGGVCESETEGASRAMRSTDSVMFPRPPCRREGVEAMAVFMGQPPR